MELAGDDELALINTCMQLEQELRQKEFADVERLLAFLPRGGHLDYRLRRLSTPDFARAALCLYELGWIDY
ncbi:MAG: hypothetical protein M3R26_01640 [Actinomycetota bacterium]|nr:hypothetical protein [Actinomycetota bacterium]MDQ2981014.1 hypothetical protein [Actinomycetota bacterium]